MCNEVPPEGTKFHCTECSVWDQDCPDGEKCNAWSNAGGEYWNATICSSVHPDADEVGEPCSVDSSPASGHDSCITGAMCWEVDPHTLQGECVALCGGSELDPICPATTECVILNDGVLSLCLPTCDPLAATCNAGESCHPVGTQWFCLPDGAPVVVGHLTPTLCEPGSTAIDPSTASFCEPDSELCCAQICDVTALDCAPSATCTPVGEGNAGVCID
jgi:hypothetical protein